MNVARINKDRVNLTRRKINCTGGNDGSADLDDIARVADEVREG